jgi:hypothetical protein
VATADRTLAPPGAATGQALESAEGGDLMRERVAAWAYLLGWAPSACPPTTTWADPGGYAPRSIASRDSHRFGARAAIEHDLAAAHEEPGGWVAGHRPALVPRDRSSPMAPPCAHWRAGHDLRLCRQCSSGLSLNVEASCVARSLGQRIGQGGHHAMVADGVAAGSVGSSAGARWRVVRPGQDMGRAQLPSARCRVRRRAAPCRKDGPAGPHCPWRLASGIAACSEPRTGRARARSAAAAGTIRGGHSLYVQANIVYGSDSLDSAGQKSNGKSRTSFLASSGRPGTGR